nr:hypothetical protein [Tanacetum cinerariifolium]
MDSMYDFELWLLTVGVVVGGKFVREGGGCYLLLVTMNTNPSSFDLRTELLHLKKKMEVKLWLGDDGSVDSLVSSDNEFEEEEEEGDLEYFDTFPTMKELGYHEWLLKNP